jgi:lipopolysaccharide/colanic/teichoic acid biosynthesis glycosyltransferase
MTSWLRARWPLDGAVAMMLALLCSPVIAVLVALIRGQDSGPALIRLERVGRHGRLFGQWKLRSMRLDGNTNSSTGPPITGIDDPRVTELGRRLRKWRLDELPQLINVIAGQMALVGPRPETPSYVDLADPRWQDILRARPGIAGPTQVLVADWEAEFVAGAEDPDAYRNIVLPLKLSIDRWYVSKASPWLDLLVIVGVLHRFFGAPTDTALYARVLADVPSASLLRTVPNRVTTNRYGRSAPDSDGR